MFGQLIDIPLDTGGDTGGLTSPNLPTLPDFQPGDGVRADSGTSQGAVAAGSNTVGGANNSQSTPAVMQFASCFVFAATAGLAGGLHLENCAASVMYIIMWIFSWILWLSGKILDMSVYYTINLADLLNHVPVVDIGWRIFRDLANIFFIFILLWVAIGTILGLISGKTKEIIVHLVIVALLMNFSLFITKTVIDASNIVAIHFYNLIVTGTSTGTPPTTSLSGAFMEGLKIQTLFQPQTPGGQAGGIAGLAADYSGGIIDAFKVILIGGFGIAVMMIASYIFFVAAILFIVRLINLMMVMILSPLAFLAFVLPSTEKYADQWKEKLIGQSIFAPIYLAITYVVIKTIQSPAFTSVVSVNNRDTGASVMSASALIFYGASDTGSAAGFAFVFNFILLIGLMLGSILVAKKMEAGGIEFAVEAGKTAGGFIGRSVARGKYITAVSSTYSGAVGGIGGRVANVLGFKDTAKSLREHAAKVSAKGDFAQKKMDMNEWDRKFGRSAFGTTELGSFIREKTTGGALFGTKAKFGGEKSVGESYEESEHLRDEAQDVERANDVKRAALVLQSEIKNPKATKTKGELLAKDASGKFLFRPAVLPDKPDGKGGLREMTEDEWVADLQKKERDENKKILLDAVQSAVTRLPSTGLVHLQEEVIKTVLPYSTERQVDELIKSTDGGWTKEDKDEFLEIYFNQLKEDGEKASDELEAFDQKLAAYEQEVREGKFAIDSATGKVITDNKGRVIAKGTTLDADGNASGDTFEIPEYKQTDAFRAVYAKTRRYMSDKGFELLNIVNFSSHLSQSTKDRLKREGKNEKEGNLLRAVPAIGKIMKWGTVQNIRDPNKTSGFTDQFRVDIRSIKDADWVKLLTVLREQKDPITGEFMYRNTDDERAEALRTGNFELTVKDNLWEARARDFLAGRAAVESANTPGGLRKLYENIRLMGAEVLRETAKKDPVDVKILLEGAFQALKENEEGERMMTVETQQLIRKLIQTKEGWDIGQKMENAEFQRMRERLEKAFRADSKNVVEFTDWTDPAQRAAAIAEGLEGRFNRMGLPKATP